MRDSQEVLLCCNDRRKGSAISADDILFSGISQFLTDLCKTGVLCAARNRYTLPGSPRSPSKEIRDADTRIDGISDLEKLQRRSALFGYTWNRFLADNHLPKDALQYDDEISLKDVHTFLLHGVSPSHALKLCRQQAKEDMTIECFLSLICIKDTVPFLGSRYNLNEIIQIIFDYGLSIDDVKEIEELGYIFEDFIPHEIAPRDALPFADILRLTKDLELVARFVKYKWNPRQATSFISAGGTTRFFDEGFTAHRDASLVMAYIKYGFRCNEIDSMIRSGKGPQQLESQMLFFVQNPYDDRRSKLFSSFCTGNRHKL